MIQLQILVVKKSTLSLVERHDHMGGITVICRRPGRENDSRTSVYKRGFEHVSVDEMSGGQMRVMSVRSYQRCLTCVQFGVP